MVAYNDTLVVFGGEHANGTLLNDLWVFNVSSRIWKRMEANNNPPGLASHCSSVVDDKIIIFGGKYMPRKDVLAAYSGFVFHLKLKTLSWVFIWKNVLHSLLNNFDLVWKLECFLPCSITVHHFIVGQTQQYGFSHLMYTYDLALQNGWKTIIYNLAKVSDLRLVGHTCVYYSPLRSLLIFGGYKITSGRYAL